MAQLINLGWIGGQSATHGWQGTGVSPSVITGAESSILDIGEDGLQMAAAISLFSDRRYTFKELDEHTPNDRRGWWGDNTLAENDYIGSFLWRLQKAKMIDDQVLQDVEAYIRQALNWMIEDGVAKEILIGLRKEDNDTIISEIEIVSPDELENTRFHFTWNLYKKEIGLVI